MRNRVLGVGAVLLAFVAILWLWQAFTAVPDEPSPSNRRFETAQIAAVPADADSPAEPTAVAAPANTERTDAAPQQKAVAYVLRVVNPDNQPIAGVEVSTCDDLPPFATTTDENGRCKVRAPRGLNVLSLRVALGDRHIQTTFTAGAETTITLPWAGPLEGHVVDFETGEPIANALVTRDHNYCRGCSPDVMRSDAGGKFTFAGVPRGRNAVLTFAAEGYAMHYDARRLAGKGEPVQCKFRLQRGVALRGRLIDSQTSDAIAGAKLRWEGQVLATSALDGRFFVRVVPDHEGKAPLQVTADGYCRHSYTIATTNINTTDPSDYPMVRSATLEGVVQDGKGVAIGGVRVRQQRRGRATEQPANCTLEEAEHFIRTTSDTNGRFVLAGLIPNAKYILQPRHDDYDLPPNSRQQHTAWTRSGELPITLSLRAKPPVAGLGSIRGIYKYNGLPDSSTINWQAAGRRGSVSVNPDGMFEIENVPAGLVELTAIANRYRRTYGELEAALHDRRKVALGIGQTLQLTIDHRIAEKTISGTVRFPDSSPAAGHTVYASKVKLHGLRTTTDERGTYSLLVPTIVGTLDVSTIDGQPASRTVRPGDTRVDFTAVRKMALRYRITDVEGRILRPTIVASGGEQRYPHEIMDFDFPDADGYREELLPKADYKLFVAAAGFAPILRHVHLDRTTELRAVLQRGVSVTVRLAPDAAEPDTQLRVRLLDMFEGGIVMPRIHVSPRKRHATLQHDGASIPHVGPGTHRLTCDNPKFEIVPNTVEVGATNTSIEIRWRKKTK